MCDNEIHERNGEKGMAIRIAIADDERPARSEMIHQLQELIADAEILEADSGATVLDLVTEQDVDLLFLDINLGDIQGTHLVKALKRIRPNMKIVFVTAYSEYAVEAFELEVNDYIMKPFSPKRLKRVLDKCLRKEQKEQQVSEEFPIEEAELRRLAISCEGKTVFEDIRDIVFIETCNRGCTIHVKGKEYYEGKTIGEYEKKLEGKRFFRCQKSYLINLDQVKEVFPWKNSAFGIRMNSYESEILPVARDKMKMIRHLLGL